LLFLLLLLRAAFARQKACPAPPLSLQTQRADCHDLMTKSTGCTAASTFTPLAQQHLYLYVSFQRRSTTEARLKIIAFVSVAVSRALYYCTPSAFINDGKPLTLVRSGAIKPHVTKTGAIVEHCA